MLSRQLDVKCQWCSNLSKLGEWNDNSYKSCTNREMKRAFTDLTNKDAFNKNKDVYYKCPVCSKWSRGSQLILEYDNGDKHIKLGGQSII